MNSTERAELRKQLLTNGYRPLPLLDKGIRIKGWSTATIDEAWLKQYERSARFANTGIRCDDLIAFDIDVTDEAMAGHIEEQIETMCGSTDFCRVGAWPKRLLLYRLEGDPIRSARTGKYDGHQVELLTGSGRQFAAYGKHPGTKKDYEWLDDHAPDNTPISQLPGLDTDKAQAAMAALEAYFEASGLKRDSQGTSIGRAGQISYDLQDSTQFLWNGYVWAWEDLKHELTESGIFCDIMRENGEFGDSCGVHCFLAYGTGTPVAHDFPRDTTHQDATPLINLPPLDTGGGAGAGSLFTQRTVLDDMLEKWVLFNDATVRRVNHPNREYPLSGLKVRMRPITVPTPTRQNPNKTTPVVDVWLGRADKLTADVAQLRPDHPDTLLISEGEETVFNTYRRPHHTDAGDYRVFLRFLDHLLPKQSESQLFLDWLALKIKHPSWRMHGVVMVTPTYGTGRGTLFEIIEGLLGAFYVPSIGYDDLFGTGGQSAYNGFLASSLVVTMNELLENSDHRPSWEARRMAYERLKTICEPNARPMYIKRKYGKNSIETVFASLLIASNHKDAMAIEPGDRRLIVLENGRTPLAENRELSDAIHHFKASPAGLGGLYRMLLERAEHVEYDPFGHPPDTPAKTRMVDAGQSDFDRLWQQFVETAKGDICVHYQWEMFARRAQLDGVHDLPDGERFGRGLKAIIQQRAERIDGLNNRTIKVDGRPERPWIIRDFERWQGSTLDGASREEIRNEIVKNGHTQANVTALKPRS